MSKHSNRSQNDKSRDISINDPTKKSIKIKRSGDTSKMIGRSFREQNLSNVGDNNSVRSKSRINFDQNANFPNLGNALNDAKGLDRSNSIQGKEFIKPGST